MKAPAVSGSHAYRELCLAARNEEKRIAELAKRQQYRKSKWETPERLAPSLQEQDRPRTQQDRYIPNPDRYQGSGPNHSRNQGLGLNYDRYSRNQGPGANQDPHSRDQGSGPDRRHYQDPGREQERYSRGQGPGAKRCFKCNEVGHIMRDCPQGKSGPEPRAAGRGVNRQVITEEASFEGENNGTALSNRDHDPLSPYLLSPDSDDDAESLGPRAPCSGASRQVIALPEPHLLEQNENTRPTGDQNHLQSYLLLSDSDSDSEVRRVRIADRGSKPQYADVQIENIPARGVIDSGSDITIMGGELFRHVATVARLRKSQLRKPNRVPKAYDGRTFTLDGMMDLDITFNGVTMKTPIYIKATASEQLLLGEGVCRQLRIISYHPDISDRKGKKWHPPPLPEQLESVKDKNASVPAVDQQDSPASVQPGRKNQPRGQVQDGNCTPGEEAPATKKNRHQRRSRRPRRGHKDNIHTTSGENRSHVSTQEGAHHPATGNPGAASATTTQGGPHHPNSGAIPDMTTEGAVRHSETGSSGDAEFLHGHGERVAPATMTNGGTQTETRGHTQQPLPYGSSPDAVVPQKVTGTTQTKPEVEVGEDVEAVVPMVRVHLLQTVTPPDRLY
jgi:hypothetical protein